MFFSQYLYEAFKKKLLKIKGWGTHYNKLKLKLLVLFGGELFM